MAKRVTRATKKVAEINEQATVDALKTYQHKPMVNEVAAKGESSWTEDERKYFDCLDSAMYVLPDMELTRITIPENIEDYLVQAGVSRVEDLIGRFIVHRPYMSTSKAPLKDRLERRYSVGLEKPVCIVVHTEGKAIGIDINEKIGQNDFAFQQEVILKRAQKFYVEKVVMGNGWGEEYPIIHLYAV